MDVVITKDPPSDLDEREPHGVVAVKEGVKPNNVGKLNPADLKFFGPGEKPSPTFNKIAFWRPGKLNKDWPPVKMPDISGPAKVVPMSKVPKSQGRDDPLTGVWKHNDDTDDANWDQMDVVITKEPVAFLEPGEPHGVVAVKEGVKPNKVGKLDPADLKFFSPGAEAPSTYNKVGHWRARQLNQIYPPSKPTWPDVSGPARVVPMSKAPKSQGVPLTGVWKHTDDTDDSEWSPMDVIITKDPPSDLGKREPHGIVAVDRDAKLNKVGKLNPEDLAFFSRSSEPPPAFTAWGHWRPRKKSSQEWPPTTKPKPLTTPKTNAETSEKSTLPSFDGQFAKVFPKSKLQQKSLKDLKLRGVWEHNDGFDDSDWEPIGVFISADPPEGEFQGIVAVEEGDPSHLKFFTPGETPPSKYKKVGHWKPGKRADWPPGQAMAGPKTRDVGKLRVPSFFRGK